VGDDGFPNIAIVVGSRATLVVVTGMGPENGVRVAHVVAKLAPNNSRLFLMTTHITRSRETIHDEC